MKIVIVGGHGLIGSKLVRRLGSRGHEVLAASRRSGVNSVTGEGLADALRGAHTVIDVTNSPSFEAPEVLDFFLESSARLMAYGQEAGVVHHLALSVVGTPRLQTSSYFQAKLAQERIIQASGSDYTLLRSTQFFEFMATIAPRGHERELVHLSPSLVQPVAADDVADYLAELVLMPPKNAICELAGPESFRLCDLVQWVMYANQDDRPVVADESARYYGAILDDLALTPDADARIGHLHFRDWLDTYLPNMESLPHVHHPNPLASVRLP